MSGYPPVISDPYWLKSQIDTLKRSIDDSNRRALGSSQRIAYGTIDPNWFYGLPNVTLANGDVAQVSGWENGLVPRPGDAVAVMRDSSGSFFIVDVAPVLSFSNVYTHTVPSMPSNFVDYATDWHEFEYGVTADGITVFQGLAKVITSAVAANGVIGVLPPEHRPHGVASTERIRFPISTSDAGTAVDIYGNGNICLVSGATVGQFVSLQSVAFPNVSATGVSWTPIGLAGSSDPVRFNTNWAKYSDVTFTVPRYWTDSYGLTWFQGIITTPATLPADNSNMIIFPSTMAPTGQMHMLSTAQGGFQVVGADNGASGHAACGLNYKANTPAMVVNGAMSICVQVPADSGSLPWVSPVMQNSWSQHGAVYQQPGYAYRAGLVILRGLVDSGTMNAVAFNLPAGFRPYSYHFGLTGHSVLQNRPSNNGRGRVDVQPNGDVVPTQGGNPWFSFDSFILLSEQ